MLFDYTTELRTFFENLPVNSDQSIPHKQVIENGRSKLFDFEYPIFDPAYKNVFETHFIRKFYMREIGFETFGLFKFQLESWLIINMPYFNKMFESELMEFDPLTNTKVDSTNHKTINKTQTDERNILAEKTSNVDGTTGTQQTSTMDGNSNSTNTNNETGSATDNKFNRNLESNNPDSRLTITSSSGFEGIEVIEYASSIKENKDTETKSSTVDGESTGTETSHVESGNTGTVTVDETVTQNDNKTDNFSSAINDVEDYVSHKIGKIGVQSFSKMMQEYRTSLIRVENQIFDEMNQLFMLVY